HIAGRDACGGSRTAADDSGYDRTRSGGPGLDLDAEERRRADVHAGRGVPGDDLLRDRERLADPDRVAVARARAEDEAARGSRVHADHLAGAVQQRAARVARLEVRVRLDQAGQALRAAGIVADDDRLVDAGDGSSRGDQAPSA